jgi:hypothetical protein
VSDTIRIPQFELTRPLRGMQRCRDCGTELMACNLRPWSHNGPPQANEPAETWLCDECFALAKAALDLKARNARAQLVLSTLAGRLSKLENTPQLEDEVIEVVKQFGGLAGFAKFLHAEILRASELKPGHPFVMNGLSLVTRMVEASSKLNRKTIPMQDLPEEELLRIIGESTLAIEAQTIRVEGTPNAVAAG